jgi:hypothetical protein
LAKLVSFWDGRRASIDDKQRAALQRLICGGITAASVSADMISQLRPKGFQIAALCECGDYSLGPLPRWPLVMDFDFWDGATNINTAVETTVLITQWRS